MRKIIEYTLISVDGVFANPAKLGFMGFRDDAYLRDGQGVLSACDAMLMGRNFYESSVKTWTARPQHPWSDRLNNMTKYVYSSTLHEAEWNNTTIVAGTAITAVRRLKEQNGGDLLIWGHTRLAETLMRHGLIDVLELSIHPMLAGSSGLFWRDGLNVDLKLTATKTFSKIVKLTYDLAGVN